LDKKVWHNRHLSYFIINIRNDLKGLLLLNKLTYKRKEMGTLIFMIFKINAVCLIGFYSAFSERII